MKCPRCAAEMHAPNALGAGGLGPPGTLVPDPLPPGPRPPPWCRACEQQYDTWVRRHAADIIWQTGIGAIVAMLIGLGLPLLGLEPIIGIAGVLVGFTTFLGLRQWGNQRRRRQFLADALPRAYLPGKAT